MQNPGFAVVFDGPGRRTVSSGDSARVTPEAAEVFMRAEEGECVAAAIVNAVEILQGRASAERAKQYLLETGRHARSIASCARDIEKLYPGYDLRKIPPASVDEFRKDKVKWLSSLGHGVWIARFLKSGVFDHCIVVDGVRKVILDSAELYSLPLSVESLLKCAGGSFKKVAIAEVRLICPA